MKCHLHAPIKCTPIDFMLMQARPARQAIWNDDCRVGNYIQNQSNAALLDMLLTNPNCASFRKSIWLLHKAKSCACNLQYGSPSPWHRMTKNITQACKSCTQMITFGSKNILTAISNHKHGEVPSGTLKYKRLPQPIHTTANDAQLDLFDPGLSFLREASHSQ